MEKKRIAVNGLGRIGRLALRKLACDERFEVVAVNDVAPVSYTHLARPRRSSGPRRTRPPSNTFPPFRPRALRAGPACLGKTREPPPFFSLTWSLLIVWSASFCNEEITWRAAYGLANSDECRQADGRDLALVDKLGFPFGNHLIVD